MSKPHFSTPPLKEEDFKEPGSDIKWSQFIDDGMKEAIKKQEDTVGAGNCQFYNSRTNPAKTPIKAEVLWKGFPKRLKDECPDNYYEVADRKGGWPRDGEENKIARNQDEYLEWYVYKNQEGKITRIDFTCEGPEYWQSLFEWEPNTCLDLYKQYISPDVKMADLCTMEDGNRVYNPYNKWNTTHGCMHLNCPPNSLSAEINLGADASIIRKKGDRILTTAQELINCSKYGLASRNSDPHIGLACNDLCRDNKRITLADPVCLFIHGVDNSSWTAPDGSNAFKYMKKVRGTKDQGLRYSLTVPDSENFTVGDIRIAGRYIIYGGQITELMDVALVAECSSDSSAQPAYPCVSEKDKSAHPLLKIYSWLKNNQFSRY